MEIVLTEAQETRHRVSGKEREKHTPDNKIKLPPPRLSGQISLEEALMRRASIRHYRNLPIKLNELSQLLWAAQGITHDEKRTVPSAGALFPLEIYVVIGAVDGLPEGVYHYFPKDHSLELISKGDKRRKLQIAALMQESITQSAVVFIFAAVYSRTIKKYLAKGKKYVHMEAGHAAQNVLLQAIPLQIGGVPMGAFSNTLVKMALHLSKNEEPLYLMPLGRI